MPLVAPVTTAMRPSCDGMSAAFQAIARRSSRMGITFTGEALDRVAEHRGDAAWLAAQAADPAARAVLAGDDGIHVTEDERLALVPLAALDAPEPLLLGLDADGPVFAVDVDPDGGPRPVIADRGEGPPHAGTGTRPIGLRGAAAVLPPADAGLAAHAAALLNWHRRHRHCSVCGTPTPVAEGGIVRHCPNCGAQHHPRTDPVVIMLVTDGDRVLLGRQPTWPQGRYSALAGFVEPGESLEEAVAREVREEAGVEVGPPRVYRLPAVAVPQLADARIQRPLAVRRAAPHRRRAGGCALVRTRRSGGCARRAAGSAGRAAALRDRQTVAGALGTALACVREVTLEGWIFMIGLRVFDVGALIVWLVWFFRLRDDDDDSDDFRRGDGNAPEPEEPKGPSGGLGHPAGRCQAVARAPPRPPR